MPAAIGTVRMSGLADVAVVDSGQGRLWVRGSGADRDFVSETLISGSTPILARWWLTSWYRGSS